MTTAKKPPIVLLHGWGLSGTSWDTLTDELKRHGYTVYTPDFPGFGNHPPIDTAYTMDDYALFLDSYLKEKGIKSPVLVGHSFGGRVALVYLARTKSDARGLVLSGVPGYRPVRLRRYIPARIIAMVGKAALSMVPFGGMVERLRARYYHLVGARDYTRARPVMRETFKNVVSYSLVDAMKAVQIPTLLLWGSRDNVVPMFVAQKMHKTIAGSTLASVPDGGHNTLLDTPNEASPILLQFVQTV